MSKLYCSPIEVLMTPAGLPLAFQWRKRWYHVTRCTVNHLKQQKDWRIKNIYLARFQCETEQGMVCNLVKEKDGWILERIWD